MPNTLESTELDMEPWKSSNALKDGRDFGFLASSASMQL